MSFLSSFYPNPVVAGTTEGTFAEGNHTHELDELAASSIPAGKVLTATGVNSASWEDPAATGDVEEAPENGVIYGRKDADWIDITSPANLQIRRGTAAEVNAITPLEGEPVWETDTKKLKVGDGVSLGGVNANRFPLNGTLRNPIGYGSAKPAPGSVFVSSEVETVGGVFLGGPYVTGNARGFGAVDLQGERTAATQVASGNLSFISSSARCTASATSASVISSSSTVCSAQYSLAVGCLSKTVSGSHSLSVNSSITANHCAAFNGVADRIGMLAHGTYNNVSGFGPTERVQTIELILKQRTTGATSADLVLDDTGGITSLVKIPTNTAMFGQIDVCAVQETTGAQAAHYIRKFGVKNVSGNAELVGSVTTIGTDYESSSGLDISVTAGNTNDVLNISVTGLASTNLRWVGIVRATEVELA